MSDERGGLTNYEVHLLLRVAERLLHFNDVQLSHELLGAAGLRANAHVAEQKAAMSFDSSGTIPADSPGEP